MAQQTAVEWLIEQINHYSWNNVIIDIPKDVIEQAKQMEKNELKKFFNAGFVVQEWDKRKVDLAEQHYNETYNK